MPGYALIHIYVQTVLGKLSNQSSDTLDDGLLKQFSHALCSLSVLSQCDGSVGLEVYVH